MSLNVLSLNCVVMFFSQRLREKMKSGQPVTFTDFFGMLIGQTLLGPKVRMLENRT